MFASSADPVVLDFALISDGESYRPMLQMYETLIKLKPGTTELEPGLAKSWESNEDGLEWTFTLQEGVTFHDGTPFNAEAVCANFDRWYNFTGPLRATACPTTGSTSSGRFAEPDDRPAGGEPLRELRGAGRRHRRHHPHPALRDVPQGLALPPFSIASPAALKEFGANERPARRRRQLPPTDVRHRAPDRHRTVHVRSWIRKDRLTSSATRTTGASRRCSTRSSSARSPTTRPGCRPCRPARSTATTSSTRLTRDDRADDDLQLIDRPSFNVGYVGFNQSFAAAGQPRGAPRRSPTPSTARP